MPEDSTQKTDDAAVGEDAPESEDASVNANSAASANSAVGEDASVGEDAAGGEDAPVGEDASEAPAAVPRAESSADTPPAADAPPAPSVSSPDFERARRKQREGVVVSNSMDRTAVVVLTERVRHRNYGKIVQRRTRLYVHDAEGALGVGDKVRVAETRPLSKKKRWRLVEILERAR